MFNSDTTGELNSKLREPRTAKQETAPKSRMARASSLRPTKGQASADGGIAKSTRPKGKLMPTQLDAIRDINVGGILKNRIVEKSQQVQAKSQEFASVDHLSSDAAAMFVDNELSKGAMHRARLHLIHCAECREEINRQRDTVDFVRSECQNQNVTAPTDLKAKLMSLANECSPGPGADDLAIQRPESFVAKVESVVRAVRRTQGR